MAAYLSKQQIQAGLEDTRGIQQSGCWRRMKVGIEDGGRRMRYELRWMNNSVLRGNFREGKRSEWFGNAQKTFKGEVGYEWVVGKITHAWSNNKSLPAFPEKIPTEWYEKAYFWQNTLRMECLHFSDIEYTYSSHRSHFLKHRFMKSGHCHEAKFNGCAYF